MIHKTFTKFLCFILAAMVLLFSVPTVAANSSPDKALELHGQNNAYTYAASHKQTSHESQESSGRTIFIIILFILGVAILGGGTIKYTQGKVLKIRIIGGIAIAMFISNSIAKQMSTINSSIANSSEQVASASEQLASSSQQMSEVGRYQ